MIYAQMALAKAGFSVEADPVRVRGGGWLATTLAPGAAARRGRVWRWPGTARGLAAPGPEEGTSAVVERRILEMLETCPPPAWRRSSHGRWRADARRGADAGRWQGPATQTSGVWRQPTITNIARNPLLRAVVAYGRRSMGDQLRFSPEGPRILAEADLRPDGKPKVLFSLTRPGSVAPARYEPLVDGDTPRAARTSTLAHSAGTQRGKPRSRDPPGDPLGGRVFDMACGWPLVPTTLQRKLPLPLRPVPAEPRGRVQAQPRRRAGGDAVRARMYADKKGAGPGLARSSSKPGPRDRRTRLDSRPDQGLVAKRAALAAASRRRERAAQNMALAEDQGQYRAVAAVFDQLRQEEQRLDAELRQLEREAAPALDVEAEVGAAMAGLEEIADLGADPTNLGAIGELFRRLNVRLFLSFREERPKKRIVNRVTGGVVTFGATAPPVALYEGPTGRRALKGRRATETGRGLAASPALPAPSGEQDDSSLGTVSRERRDLNLRPHGPKRYARIRRKASETASRRVWKTVVLQAVQAEGAGRRRESHCRGAERYQGVTRSRVRLLDSRPVSRPRPLPRVSRSTDVPSSVEPLVGRVGPRHHDDQDARRQVTKPRSPSSSRRS